MIYSGKHWSIRFEFACSSFKSVCLCANVYGLKFGVVFSWINVCACIFSESSKAVDKHCKTVFDIRLVNWKPLTCQSNLSRIQFPGKFLHKLSTFVENVDFHLPRTMWNINTRLYSLSPPAAYISRGNWMRDEIGHLLIDRTMKPFPSFGTFLDKYKQRIPTLMENTCRIQFQIPLSKLFITLIQSGRLRLVFII